MFGIMKKDWYFHIGYLVMVPLQLLYWHTTTSIEQNIDMPEGIFDLPEDIKALRE